MQRGKNAQKLGPLILRKIIKILATRCHILRLKCTKFDFGWGRLQRSPRPFSWIQGGLLLREGREGEGERGGEKGRGKGRGREGEGDKKGWGRDGEK